MLNTVRDNILVADDTRMICKSCKEETALKAPENASPLAQYAVAVDIEKCIGCQMCMIDCAAHHADAKHTPVVYPQAWDLLPEARLFGEGRAAQKCDMCVERLQEGIDPVCVQICPRGALSVKKPPEERRRLFKLISK